MKLDNKIRELIAVGASVTANCHPCVQYHLGKARGYRADEQEIGEAVAVGKQVRRGAASEMDKVISNLGGGALPCSADTGKETGCAL